MSVRPKILFLVQLPPPVHGSSSINKMFVESPVINSSFDLRVIPLQFSKGMSDIGLFTPSKLLKMGTYALRITRTLISFRPALVYFTITLKGIGFYRDIFYAAILKLSGAKIVYHIHVKGIKEECERSSIKKLFYRFVFSNTYIITLSEGLAYDLHLCYKGKPYVIHNGILPVFKESSRPDKANPDDKVKLLYLSNLMRAKGLFVLLESLQLLRSRRLVFSARIIGKPSDVSIQEIEYYLKKNDLMEYVTVEDAKYGEEKYAAFENSDIFVHPTLNDAFPLVILEAMQFQLPVVSSIEGAIPEMVDQGTTGLLVSKGDPNALMENMALLISDYNLRQQMGKAGRAKFLSNYTSDKMEQRLQDVLSDILSS